MCKIPNITTEITKIDCFENRGKITFYLNDKRVIIIPMEFFPEIKALTPKQRRHFQIIDGQDFSFEALAEIWGLKDILKLQY